MLSVLDRMPVAMAAERQQQQRQKQEDMRRWRKEEIVETVREFIHTNPSPAALILVCLLLISWWMADFVSQAVRCGWLVLAPHLWKAAVAWLTRSVLFLLLHAVVFCIWVSSFTTAAAHGNQEHAKSDASSSLSSSSGQACLAEKKNKKKRNSISAQADSSLVEFNDGNPEIPALETPSKEDIIIKNPWKSYLETSYTDQEISGEIDSVQAGQKRKNFNSLSLKARDYPESSTRVIVRNVSVNSENSESAAQNGMRVPLVIPKDELNERIKALYAKSREQRRQDSLQRN